MPIRFHKPEDANVGTSLRRDGVAFVDGLLDAAAVEETRHQLARYEREVLPGLTSAYKAYYEDGTLCMMQNLDRFEPWFAAFARRPRLLDMVRAAVGWDPVVYYVETFPKPPGAGAIGAHQELFTQPVEPAHFVHLWIALSDVSAANGGMAFYRASHKLGLAPHVEEPSYAPMVEPELLEQLSRFRLEADFPAGSAALFDCLTIHCSGANDSAHPRPVAVIGYRDRNSTVPSNDAVLPTILARMFREETGATHCGVDDEFTELGGDAAAAQRVLDRVRADTGLTLDLGELTSHSTPTRLAARITELTH
jgi:phytanoyl-CoA hydroxylase